MLDRARQAFRAQFGRDPRWSAAAPGRVNLIGEHTDYNGGFVLPIAIDRVCVAVGGPAADSSISRVFAADLNTAGSFDARQPLTVRHPLTDVATGVERGSWLSYVAGVVAQYQRRDRKGACPNLDIAVASSVPLGSGLSSSAAIEVATATLLEQVLGTKLPLRERALLCQAAEHEFAGVPCGIMDQFISVMGREGHALLIDCRSQETTPVPMPSPDEAVIVVMNTNVHHSLAAGEYAKRRATCASAAAKLGVRELRDASVQSLTAGEGRLTPEEHKRALHVITENTRTLAAVEALRWGDLATLGRLMLESHASLRDDYEVSCPELDTLVDTAAATSGVFGARMTGGGFGGCAIALVAPAAVGDIARSVTRDYARVHAREATMTAILAADGAA